MSNLSEFFVDLVRTGSEVSGAVDARLRADHAVRLTQFQPLSVIGRLGGCRVHEIAYELGITTGGASKRIDTVEAEGLCTRRSNPDDRRSSLLDLTDEGRQLLVGATFSFEDELEHFLGGVSCAELAQMASTMSRIRCRGSELDSDRPHDG